MERRRRRGPREARAATSSGALLPGPDHLLRRVPAVHVPRSVPRADIREADAVHVSGVPERSPRPVVLVPAVYGVRVHALERVVVKDAEELRTRIVELG